MKWILNQTRRVIRKCIRMMILIISLPITFVLILLFPFYKVKLIALFSDRIGHYAMNTELLLCYLDEIKQTDKRTSYVFYPSEAPVCNQQLDIMWKRVILIVPFSVLASYIDFFMSHILGAYYKDNALKESIATNDRDIHERLKKYESHLCFTEKELRRGSELCLKLGIPSGVPFICLSVRDSAYLDKFHPNKKWSYHQYRDCDISNFEKAALFLANKGYYVIRMGKAVAKPFSVDHPHIIDYACHPLRSDFLDIYLSAHCEFFISTALGLDMVPKVFRRPVLLVNVAPMRSQLEFFYPNEFFIPKKIFDNNRKRFLSFQEIDREITHDCNVQEKLNQLSWRLVENSPDEILAVVSEMEDYVLNKKTSVLHNKFHDYLKKPWIFSMIACRSLFTSHPEKFHIRMGYDFIQKNSYLFAE